MSKPLILILLAVAALFALSVAWDSRIAAVGGAAVLLAAIIYETIRAKRSSRREDEISERGAVQLRKELQEEDERRD